MQTLFGIPVNTLAYVLLAVFAIAGGIVALAALRNRVFLRLGVRDIWRRRSRTLLIVIGLMLGTALISAALNTGDTLSHSVRTSAIRSLGNTDELVGLKGVSATQFGVFAVVDYFDQGTLTQVRDAANASGQVDGVAPAIIETDRRPGRHQPPDRGADRPLRDRSSPDEGLRHDLRCPAANARRSPTSLTASSTSTQEGADDLGRTRRRRD